MLGFECRTMMKAVKCCSNTSTTPGIGCSRVAGTCGREANQLATLRRHDPDYGDCLKALGRQGWRHALPESGYSFRQTDRSRILFRAFEIQGLFRGVSGKLPHLIGPALCKPVRKNSPPIPDHAMLLVDFFPAVGNSSTAYVIPFHRQAATVAHQLRDGINLVPAAAASHDSAGRRATV